MKYQIIALLMLSTIGSTSFAKAPLQVDFNKMIDETNLDRSELNKPAPEAAVEQAAEVPSANRRAVIDFIDMEISVGADSAVVDSN